MTRIATLEGLPVKGYRGLVITGRCGVLDEKRGRELRERPGDEKRGYRVYPWFDPNSWDGNDIFAPEGTAFWLVTRKVKETIESAKLTNVKIRPLSII